MGLSRSDHALFAPLTRGIFFVLSGLAILHVANIDAVFADEGEEDYLDKTMNPIILARLDRVIDELCDQSLPQA